MTDFIAMLIFIGIKISGIMAIMSIVSPQTGLLLFPPEKRTRLRGLVFWLATIFILLVLGGVTVSYEYRSMEVISYGFLAFLLGFYAVLIKFLFYMRKSSNTAKPLEHPQTKVKNPTQ